MSATDNDRMVAATLAAAKIAKSDLSKPIDYVLEYERILRIVLRRKGKGERETQTEEELAA